MINALPLMTETEAANMLGLEPQTLSNWRCTKRYPLPFIRCGRSIRYRALDIENFLECRTVRPIDIHAAEGGLR